MGQPVMHFEVMGKDGEKLRSYYGDLFDWEFQVMEGYGMVDADQNKSPEGIGIGGGVGQAPEGYGGHVTFYVGVEDVEAALAKAESLGGKRMMGPEKVAENTVIGLFTDPEGNTVGVASDS